MKQGYSKPLKFVSMLLVLAMLITSQTFVILATEVVDNLQSDENTELYASENDNITETEILVETEASVETEAPEETEEPEETSDEETTEEISPELLSLLHRADEYDTFTEEEKRMYQEFFNMYADLEAGQNAFQQQKEEYEKALEEMPEEVRYQTIVLEYKIAGKSYSDLNEEEKEKVLSFPGVNPTSVDSAYKALEQQGYDLFDSMVIIDIMIGDLFTIEEAIQLHSMYITRPTLDKNVIGFKEFAKLFESENSDVSMMTATIGELSERDILRIEKNEYISAEALQNAKQMLLDGHTSAEISAAHRVAVTFGMSPEELLIDSDCNKNLTEEMQAFVEIYPINVDALVATVTENRTLYTDVETQSAAAIDYEALATEVMSVGAVVYSSEEDETTEEPANIASVESPFGLDVNDRENINLNTGALNYSEPIVSLPGINGNDVTLSVDYDSSESHLAQYDYDSKEKDRYYCEGVATAYVTAYGGEAIKVGIFDIAPTLYTTQSEANRVKSELESIDEEEYYDDLGYTYTHERQEIQYWYNTTCVRWVSDPYEELPVDETIYNLYVPPTGYDYPYPTREDEIENADGYSGYLSRIETEPLGSREFDDGIHEDGRTIHRIESDWKAVFGGYVSKTFDEAYFIFTDVVVKPYPVTVYYNSTGEQTHNEQHYDIGSGWSFNIPSIDTDQKKLILPGKGTYALSGNTIKDYPLKDMVLTSDSSYNNGQFDSSKKLTFADGTVYYFNSNGLLLADVDRFGNTITYKYAEVDGEYHPSEIIDTVGRSITITYETVDTGKTVTITAPDGSSTVLHTKVLDSATYGEGNSVLEKIVYPDGETTTFDYAIEDGQYSFTKSYGGSSIKYALLDKVTYDTGAELHYAYEMRDTDLGSGHLNIYRITDRYTLDVNDDNKVIDKTKYSYTYDYSMERIYTTKVTDVSTSGEVSTEYTFNKDHLCTDQILYDGDTKKQQVATTYHTTYDLPTKVVTTVYGESGKEMETTELYTYDKFGNILTYISPKAGGSTSNTEYRTTNTYSLSISSSTYTGYNIPLTVTYKQDANTTIKVENLLTDDKKNITQTNTYVNDVLKAKTTYTYDEQGRIVTETSYPDLSLETGVVKTYTYSDGNLVSVAIENVVGNDGISSDITTSYTYDVMGRLLTVTDSNGNVIATEYDNRGRTTKVINPDGGYTEYTYDTVNNITTVNHSLLDAVAYDYDSIGLIETTRYADGTVVSEHFYDENGRLIAEALNRSSSAATTTYYTYDVFDRVTEKAVYDVNNALAYRETYEYNDVYTSILSLVTKTVHGDENAADIVTKTYTNKYGEAVKEDVGDVVTEYEYDYVGNVTRVFYDDTTLASYTYDHAGNVTSETNALGDARAITYDAIGRKISESDYKGNVINYTYDNAGRLLTMTSPFANDVNTTIKYYYDANGNVIKQQQTAQADNSTETVWRTVEYEYDCMNRVTDIINYVSDTSKQYTHYTYDEAGNLTDVYTGLTQPWSAALSPDLYSHIKYTYDGRGNNTSLTDALEQNETYQYDVLGSLVASTLRDGTVYDYTYNLFGNVTDIVTSNGEVVSERNTTYTATGAVRSVTLDGVTVSYTYDGLGNVLTETEGNVVKTYTYDNRGRKSGYTLSIDGEQITSATYAYDLLDRLTSVTEGGITTVYTYDANGNRASQTVDNVITTYAYNDANLVTELTNTLDGTVISHFAYTYYTDGNMRTKAETLEANATSNTTYLYDGVGRLVSEETDGVSITYEYDANNNRIKMTNNGVVTTYTYDANNRLLTETTDGIPTTYTYDANGNTLTSLTYYADIHTFADGVCTVCGDPETYMLGDLNGDGEITLIDVLRILKLSQAQTQTATYGLETEQSFDSADLDQNGVVDAEDYWLFLEIAIGYNRVATMSLSEGESDDAFADINGNGTVDTDDYAIALAEYNEPNNKIARLAADVNGDGEITYDDYDETLHHVLNECACGIGSTVNNTSPCTSEKSYTYNARGQQTGYMDANTTAEYAYNPSGLRNAKTVGGSTKYFVYNGMQIVFEYEHSISDGTVYYYGLNRTHNSDGEIYVYNAHGDTVQLVKNNAVVVSYTYDAFGNLTSQAGESDNPFLYCSEYFDSETQTYYLRARYYNPANGRFNAEDPHWDATNRIYGDNPFKIYEYEDALGLSKYTLLPDVSAIIQSGNLYVYCANNPIAYIDKDGNLAFLATLVISAGIGALVSGGVQVYRNIKSGRDWNQGVGTAMLAGGVSGAISTIPIPGASAATSAIIMGGVGNTVGNAIKGDISNFSDVLSSFRVGAIAGTIGYGAGEGLLRIADKAWGELSRTAQKQAITGIGNVSQKYVNVVLQEIKNGVTENIYRQLIKEYGADVVLAATVAAFGTELNVK